MQTMIYASKGKESQYTPWGSGDIAPLVLTSELDAGKR